MGSCAVADRFGQRMPRISLTLNPGYACRAVCSMDRAARAGSV